MKLNICDGYHHFGFWQEVDCYVNEEGYPRSLMDHPEVKAQIDEVGGPDESYTARTIEMYAEAEISDELLGKSFHLSEQGFPIPGFYPNEKGMDMRFKAKIYPFKWCKLTDEEIEEAVAKWYRKQNLTRSFYDIEIERKESVEA